MECKKAFTLAEVLIVLLITGVIASLVIPTLINNINNEEYVTAAKKVRSNLTQAAELIKMDNGGTYVGFFSSDTDLVNKFAEKLVYTKKCINDTNDGTCWHKDVNAMKTLDGAPWANWYGISILKGLKLNDGTLVVFEGLSRTCEDKRYSFDSTDSNDPFNYECVLISFDVNGFNPPNRMGRDIFGGLIITKKGLHAMGEAGSIYGKSMSWSLCTPGPGSGASFNGASCLARIFEEGGMKY